MLSRVCLLSAVLLAAAVSARAAAPDHANLAYLRDAAHETVALTSSPLGWERPEWLQAGGVAGGAVVLYAAADIPLRRAALRNQSRVADGFADVGRGFGNGLYIAPAMGAFYLAGEAREDRRLRRASLDALESLALSGLFVTVLKTTTGRERPEAGRGRGSWTGPSLSNSHNSFPSGHSSDAFSVATIFATEYADVPGVVPGAYALAALTGASRVYHDQHWASDVFVGGALGYFTAKAIARAHADKDGRWTFRAYPLGGGAGAFVARRF